MSRPLVIGISGKLRSGKDTAAQLMVDEYDFTQLSFAHPIKQMCIKFFDLSYEECYQKKTPRSRDIMQQVGSFFREIDPECWIRQTMRMVEKQNRCVVISDVRYENEVEAIQKWGGIVIRIERPAKDRHRMESSGTNHISETALDSYPFHHVVKNDDSLDALKSKIRSIVNGLVVC